MFSVIPEFNIEVRLTQDDREHVRRFMRAPVGR